MKKLKCIKFSFLVCLNQILSVWHFNTLDSDISIVLAAFRIDQVPPLCLCWQLQSADISSYKWFSKRSDSLILTSENVQSVADVQCHSVLPANLFMKQLQNHTTTPQWVLRHWQIDATQTTTVDHKSNDTFFKWMITAKNLESSLNEVSGICGSRRVANKRRFLKLLHFLSLYII